MAQAIKIVPTTAFADGEYRSGTLVGMSVVDIEAKLGFPANRKDDFSKVSHSWGFKVNGVFCAIWIYRGSSRLSTFGPAETLRILFGNHYA